MLLALALFLQDLPADSPAQRVARGREEAASAAEELAAGDALSALEHARRAADLRPMHGGVQVLLAEAQLGGGAPSEALATLRRVAAMGFGFDLRAEAALAPLFENPEFAAIESRLRANREPLVRSEIAFRFERPGFHAEGIAHDPESGSFFVSSFDSGEIVRIRKVDHEWRSEMFADLAQWGYYGAYGMVWRNGDLLVAAGAARATPRGLPIGSLVHLSRDGELVMQFRRWREGYPSLVGDLAVSGRRYHCYVTDPITGAVLLHEDGATFATVVEPGVLPNPQGIVCFFEASSEQYPEVGVRLIVTDYSAGLFSMRAEDPASLKPMGMPPDTCLLGIDGLALYGKSLIAIQNGIGVHRVLRLRLDGKHENVTAVEILERAHPEYGEPTLGVVVGNDFYYVANAPWGLPEGQQPPPAVVLRLPLD